MASQPRLVLPNAVIPRTGWLWLSEFGVLSIGGLPEKFKPVAAALNMSYNVLAMYWQWTGLQ